MDAIRYTLAVAGKELQVMFRDRANMAILFLLPLLLASLLGSMYQSLAGVTEGEEETFSLDVLLVNNDDGQYASQIVNVLENIDQFSIEKLDSIADADERVADAQAIAAIIIPSGFSQGINEYEPVQIQVIVDPAQEIAAGIVSGIMNQVAGEVEVVGEISYGIRSAFTDSGFFDGASPELQRAAEVQTLGVLMTQLQTMQQDPVINVQSIDLAGIEAEEQTNPFGVSVPQFTVMFSFFLIGVISATLLKEKEEGSFRRLLAAPMPPAAIIVGKMLAYMLIVILQVAVLFGIAGIAFDMPLGKSPMGLLLLTLALALSAAALGMLLASVAKTSGQADSMGMIIGFVLAGLGGIIVGFPDGSFLDKVAKFTPHNHAFHGFLGLLNDGLGVTDILPQIGAVTVFGLVFFLVAMWQFKFD